MLTTILTLGRTFLGVCLLRVAPQDLPASQTLLGLTIGAHMLSTLMHALVFYPPATAVAATLASTTLLVLFPLALLHINGLLPRLVQTITALAGAETVIQVFDLPFAIWTHAVIMSRGEATLPSLVYLAFVVWNLAVGAHVYRHAISTRLPIGFAIAVLFFFISYNVLATLFPVPPPSAEVTG